MASLYIVVVSSNSYSDSNDPLSISCKNCSITNEPDVTCALRDKSIAMCQQKMARIVGE